MKEETTVLHKCISKDELNELPLSHFEGEIQLVETLEQVDEAARYLEQQLILGFDTETRPSFKKGQTNPVALLQLSTSDKAFLFRINKIGLPESLVRILSNPKIVKSGAAIRDDIKILKNVNHFRPGGFVELQEYVKDFGIENFSLKKLAGIVLGFRISKSQRLTNWEAPVLTVPQQIYAATDAWVSYEIYVRLLEMEGQMAI
ncbi:3'-5' exonuclease [Prolixibacter sp. NT017]|uniref:3'-5' exonuclease n=1 Tax=Prolixibacter sp. NT017 TaxID=2652390 RepID=UPI0012736A32|nr:3'-5' exonuclease [Prolixibacter sp. NT017]GET24132.1 3'-5' exonuclease [Prolixibacter sp. NT017]